MEDTKHHAGKPEGTKAPGPTMKGHGLWYECRASDLLKQMASAVRSVFQLCLGSRDSLLERMTSSLVRNQVIPPGRSVVLYKSGRAALRGLLEGLQRSRPEHQVIFLPDFICQAVYQASRDAGFDIRVYRTDGALAPAWDELLPGLGKQPCPVVLLASMLGMMNATREDVGKILGCNAQAFVVADVCQHLVRDAAIGWHDQLALLFSFNRKTIPGLMGGGVCVPGELSGHLKPLTMGRREGLAMHSRLLFFLVRECCVYGLLFLRLHALFRKDHGRSEGAETATIVTDSTPHEIATLSLIRALQFVDRISDLERIRMENYQEIRSLVRDVVLESGLPEQKRAALIPVRSDAVELDLFDGVFVTRPWACHVSEEENRTPRDMLILRNTLPLRMVRVRKDV